MQPTHQTVQSLLDWAGERDEEDELYIGMAWLDCKTRSGSGSVQAIANAKLKLRTSRKPSQVQSSSIRPLKSHLPHIHQREKTRKSIEWWSSVSVVRLGFGTRNFTLLGSSWLDWIANCVRQGLLHDTTWNGRGVFALHPKHCLWDTYQS